MKNIKPFSFVIEKKFNRKWNFVYRFIKAYKIKILSIVTILLNCLVVCADDGYFGGSGDTVFPLKHYNIELISETVNIKPIWNNKSWGGKIIEWKVNCTFNFHNTGDKTTVLMGFPDLKNEEDNKWGIKDFKSYIEGEQIETSIKKGRVNENLPNLDYGRVFVWEVIFDKNEKKQLKTEYTFGTLSGSMFLGPTLYKDYINNKEFGFDEEQRKYKNFDTNIKICEKVMEELRNINYGYWGEDHEGIAYVLKTGSLWKGKIRKADIYIDIGNIPEHFFIYSENDEGKLKIPYYSKNFLYNAKKERLEWHLKNIKPDEDLYIYFISVDYLFVNEYQATLWIEGAKKFGNISKETVKFVKNSIFAKYGKRFNTPWLQFCYEYCTLWYNYSPKEYSDTKLNKTDHKILKLLESYEQTLLFE